MRSDAPKLHCNFEREILGMNKSTKIGNRASLVLIVAGTIISLSWPIFRVVMLPQNLKINSNDHLAGA
jgi:hypothetical protein